MNDVDEHPVPVDHGHGEVEPALVGVVVGHDRRAGGEVEPAVDEGAELVPGRKVELLLGEVGHVRLEVADVRVVAPQPAVLALRAGRELVVHQDRHADIRGRDLLRALPCAVQRDLLRGAGHGIRAVDAGHVRERRGVLSGGIPAGEDGSVAPGDRKVGIEGALLLEHRRIGHTLARRTTPRRRSGRRCRPAAAAPRSEESGASGSRQGSGTSRRRRTAQPRRCRRPPGAAPAARWRSRARSSSKTSATQRRSTKARDRRGRALSGWRADGLHGPGSRRVRSRRGAREPSRGA